MTLGLLPWSIKAAITAPAPTHAVTLEVLGTPAPKGSARAMLIAGRARVIASGSSTNQRKLRSWDTALREAARDAVGERTGPVFVGRALQMGITFRLTRPAGHWGKHGLRPSAPPYPIVAPDLSKLLRATEDSLIGVVFDDDSRIVVSTVSKVYAEPGREGATITIAVMT